MFNAPLHRRRELTTQPSRFGTVFTDHMFLEDYDARRGWVNGRIEPYHHLSLDPAAAVLHYGQKIFERNLSTRTSLGTSPGISSELGYSSMLQSLYGNLARVTCRWLTDALYCAHIPPLQPALDKSQHLRVDLVTHGNRFKQ